MDPMISAGVMLAKVIWNTKKTVIGMVAASEVSGAAPTPYIRPPSWAGLPIMPALPGGESAKARPNLQAGRMWVRVGKGAT
jgi:hypothetical protein